MSNETPHTTQPSRDLASVVLSRIEKEVVVPTPRWYFLFHESVVWGLGTLAVVVGALSVAAIIYTGSYADWSYYFLTHDSLISFAFDVAPYMWLVLLVLFSGTTYISVRHTKRGYRYSVPTLLAGVVGLSFIFGTTLYGVGMGRVVDEEIGSVVPLHRSLRETTLAFWNQPERGLIAGVVKEVEPDGDITLRTLEGDERVALDEVPEVVRNKVVVGSAVRLVVPPKEVLSPRVMSAPDAPSTAGFAASADPVMVGDSARLAKSAASAMESADDRVLPMNAVVEESVTPPAEACLVLPLDWERGFAPLASDSDDGKEVVEALKSEHIDCLKSFSEDI